MELLELYNHSANRPFVSQVRVADNWLSRLRGLLGTTSLADGEGIWIKPCRSIHTVGMRYPIDLVYLRANNIVDKIVEHVRVNRFSIGSRNTFSVVEIPAGFIKKSGLRVGDELRFINKDAG